jgi:DNA-binding protein YbaB
MQKEIDQLHAEVRAHRERVLATQAAVERSEVTGSADNGAVVVRLHGTGRLVEVVIDPQAMRQYNATDLGAAVVAAVDDGMRRLNVTTWRQFTPMLTGDPER